MKLSLLATTLVFIAPLVLAAPTPTERDHVERARIVKRATITDVADTGYATQNGG
jgi:pectate lyase